MSYAPVEGTDFSLAVTAPKNEVFETIDAMRTLAFIICAGFIIISILITYFLSSSISNPIKSATEKAMLLANNDFSVDVPERFLRRRDEVGTLANAFQKMIDHFNNTMENIGSAAAQVSAGSKQLSDSSTVLSQGAAEQASAVEQLTASLEEIAEQTRSNADNATHVSKISEEMKTSAANGSAQMNDMLSAMEEINQSSNNIAKIIKVIEDIAFQTNILALTAAVEAARAGQHGKGFAVVAEEVRNLAARSASAAKETTAMIEGSAKSVENGSRIAQRTSESLNEILERITEVSSLISEIAVATNEQTAGIDQINQGLEQISQVVQANSATSEESAASSEELAGQSELLKEQIMQFKLRQKQNQLYTGYNKQSPAADRQPGKAVLLSHASNIGKY
jgi:methyl-accepting chemotaxis protein